MGFKEQAIADVSTFLNVEEFGDTIDVDGVPMACVLDDAEAPTEFEGVSQFQTTLYVRTADFETVPVVRQRITVGGRQADVIHVDDQQDITALKLRWFES